MKKIASLALITLIIISSIFGIYLYSSSKSANKNNNDKTSNLQEKILSNSSWIYLTQEDFNGYLNGTYTSSVQTIITSLEEAIPVILQTSNDKFGEFENSTFIVASSFNASNYVYTYYYNPTKNTYEKGLFSLESLLEDANAVLIYNETEDLI